jgi:hypothetical protein
MFKVALNFRLIAQIDAAKHGRCAAGMKIFFKPQIPDWGNLTLPPFFSLSSAKGGEGWGEEADYSSSNPLAPALSPLRRGEGVGGSAKLCSILDWRMIPLNVESF